MRFCHSLAAAAGRFGGPVIANTDIGDDVERPMLR